jgi:hypothetical protein
MKATKPLVILFHTRAKTEQNRNYERKAKKTRLSEEITRHVSKMPRSA